LYRAHDAFVNFGMTILRFASSLSSAGYTAIVTADQSSETEIVHDGGSSVAALSC
jgi:hypothetical protein